jgi:hypothetical protein
MKSMDLLIRIMKVAPVTLALVIGAATAQAEGKKFATPQDAAKAFAVAINDRNSKGLLEIFGENAKEIISSGDEVQDKADLKRLAAAVAQRVSVDAFESTATVVIGPDSWPFPIPLVKSEGQWHFDLEAGAEEIQNRNIGRNELATIKILRFYPQAQNAYEAEDRDDDGVREYAQVFASNPGKRDGLFWKDEGGDASPLQPLVTLLRDQGYDLDKAQAADDNSAPAFNGYHFKIIKQQGSAAPGGAMNYVVNGNMVAGFALVAWPVEYSESGIQTFIVGKDGTVFEKDLGEKTVDIASKLTSYNPDESWSAVEGKGLKNKQ